MMPMKILFRLIWWFFCDCARGWMRQQEFIGNFSNSAGPFTMSAMFSRFRNEDIAIKKERELWLASQSPENYEPDIPVIEHRIGE